jgi:hypothetical protein
MDKDTFVTRARIAFMELGGSPDHDVWSDIEIQAEGCHFLEVDPEEFVRSLILAHKGREASRNLTPLPERQVAPPRRVWTRGEIDGLLKSSDRAVEKGILTLCRLQTVDERAAGETKHHNSRGFNSAHARVGTRFARWLRGMDDRNVVKFPPKSLNHELAARVFKRYVRPGGTVMGRAREICLIHSQQLTDVANGLIELPPEG